MRPCALVHNYFHKMYTGPDPDNGMWAVEPEYLADESQSMPIFHVDFIVHAAHPRPIFGGSTLPLHLGFLFMLDRFCAFYVDKYIE